MVSLVLANPNPYTALVSNTLLSPVLLAELTTVAGPRLGDLPTGSALRLPRTSSLPAGQMVACGFLPLPAGASFEWYANVTGTEGSDVYLCPPKASGGLGAYSLLAVPAPVSIAAPAPPSVSGVTTDWHDDRIAIGLGRLAIHGTGSAACLFGSKFLLCLVLCARLEAAFCFCPHGLCAASDVLV